jgi:hypothetical protein
MFYLGLDLGKKQDHSAIAVVEEPEAYWTPRGMVGGEGLLVRHVERAPLGTKYPAVVAWVRDLVADPALAGRCALAVDATGVGGPVVDMLRMGGMRCNMTEVTITGGERESQRGQWGWSVPKRDLMSGLQVALESGELRIAKGLKESGALVQELVDMRVAVRATGRVRMGAEGAGEHDDLVIAVGLAVWLARRPKPRKNDWCAGEGKFPMGAW